MAWRGRELARATRKRAVKTAKKMCAPIFSSTSYLSLSDMMATGRATGLWVAVSVSQFEVDMCSISKQKRSQLSASFGKGGNGSGGRDSSSGGAALAAVVSSVALPRVRVVAEGLLQIGEGASRRSRLGEVSVVARSSWAECSESGIVSQQTPVAAQATVRIGVSGQLSAPQLPGVDARWVHLHGRLGIGRTPLGPGNRRGQSGNARRPGVSARQLRGLRAWQGSGRESLADAATCSAHELIETCNLSLSSYLYLSLSVSPLVSELPQLNKQPPAGLLGFRGGRLNLFLFSFYIFHFFFSPLYLVATFGHLRG